MFHLECYDEPNYYNEFVLAVSEAESSIERFLTLLNSLVQSVFPAKYPCAKCKPVRFLQAFFSTLIISPLACIKSCSKRSAVPGYKRSSFA